MEPMTTTTASRIHWNGRLEDIGELELHDPRHGPMQPKHGGFVERLVLSLKSNNSGVRFDVADFTGRIRSKDYLD